AGTYLISRSIPWRNAKGIYWPWLTWQGEGTSRTMIKLKDHCPGFGNPKKPRAVTKTGCYDGRKHQNAAHGCYFHDLTINVGRGNPGAVGIDFNSHNTGAIVRVDIISEDGRGHAGLLLTRDPGPCLIKQVRIRGFDYGIRVSSLLFGVTFEHVQLTGQRLVGLLNQGNVVSVRRLISRNKVPAIRQAGWASMTILIDSELNGGQADQAAIVDEGVTLLARNVKTTGYGVAIRQLEKGRLVKTVAGGLIVEHLHGRLFRALSKNSRTLNLPVAETPEYVDPNPDHWLNVAALGAGGSDRKDDTPAIQRAIDAGKPVVYFPAGDYLAKSPIVVRGNVRKLVFFSSRLRAARKGQVLLRFENADHPVIVERLKLWGGGRIVNAAGGPVVLKHVTGPAAGQLITEGRGRTWFFEDICTTKHVFPEGTTVFARQFNTEPSPPEPGFIADGATVWILGLKTEWGNTIGVMKNHAKVEILGGLVLPAQGFRGDRNCPFFINENSSFTASWNEMTFGSGTYRNVVRETRGDQTRTLPASRKGTQHAYSLYVGTP
ncbi:MAG: hypothetical protein D6820_03570, partial [Lentisphaerae bacterium]